MRAIILAAGEGARLRPFTLDRPKCLVELAGRSLLRRQLDALGEAGVVDVTVVTGYEARRIEALGLPTRLNPEFSTTNMVASLMYAADLLDGSDDVLVAYGDLVYEPRIVTALLASRAPVSTTVDRQWLRLWRVRSDDPLADAETLRIGEDGNIVELGRRPSSLEEIEGQYMGLIRVSAAFAPTLVRLHASLDPGCLYDGRPPARMFMTSFLQLMIDRGHPVRAVPVDGGWLEIDTVEDLGRFERLLAEGLLDELCRIPRGPRPEGTL